MNILFLSLYDIKDSNSRYIYADLIKEFGRHNHNIYAVTPSEDKSSDFFVDENGVNIIRVKSGKIQKTNKIRKLLNLMSLDRKVINATNKVAKGIKFDIIFTMVSNLSLYKATQYFKKKHNAYVYMALKDIFPQNAVDMHMLKTRGVMGIVYSFFRDKEKRYYQISNKIGCMSQANCEYLVAHNSNVSFEKVEVLPNCVEPVDFSLTLDEKIGLRNKYEIPLDKKVFVYGGNLGKPQGIPFVIQCLKNQEKNKDVFFLIVGSGTEYEKIAEYCKTVNSENVKLMASIPREDYDRMIAACDVGMIFLDYQFTIPNFPSRLLAYMQAGLPVLACTDTKTDIGKVIAEGNFGWWCESNDVSAFEKCIEIVLDSDCSMLGENAKRYLEKEYSVKYGYEIILKSYERFNGLKMVNETGKGL